MPVVKRLLCSVVVLSLLFSTAVLGNAKDTDTDIDPVILVHGMMGYGENELGNHTRPYWSDWNNTDNQTVKKYREMGYEIYAPSVGPMSSAWDRACELFAQLTGTVVDYGAAHSAKYGHSRWGRDYTGNGFLERDWYETGRINIVSHSFGGPAVIIFTNLMAYGSSDEKSASPNDCSPLFEGGHGDAIFTVTTLESPSNGSTIANLLNDSVLPVWAVAAYMNLEGTKKNPGTDFMIDQWGLTNDPSTGKSASFNPKGIAKIAVSKDHCAYDMSLQGARELCEKYQPSTQTYYFAIACNMMKETAVGLVPEKGNGILNITSSIISLLAGKTFHGIQTDKTWAYNDGMVPLASALYPYSQPHTDYDGTTTTGLEKGKWYSFPIVNGRNHGYGANIALDLFWPAYFERTKSITANEAAPET